MGGQYAPHKVYVTFRRNFPVGDNQMVLTIPSQLTAHPVALVVYIHRLVSTVGWEGRVVLPVSIAVSRLRLAGGAASPGCVCRLPAITNGSVSGNCLFVVVSSLQQASQHSLLLLTNLDSQKVRNILLSERSERAWAPSDQNAIGRASRIIHTRRPQRPFAASKSLERVLPRSRCQLHMRYC